MSDGITPEQCRAGRAILKWSIDDLAKNAGVGKNTVTRFENGSDAHGTTNGHLRRALEAAGVIFIPENGGGAGVRLKKDAP